MSRFRHTDILVELIDLSHDRMNEIRSQLGYYRASVYKHETANQIEERIDHLRFISTLFGDDAVTEAFDDFDAVKLANLGASGMDYVPGDCSFSRRVTMLLATLDRDLGRLQRATFNQEHLHETAVAFTEGVKKARNQILALCRAGSRQWSFFSAL
jgi:hypothetical protein